MKITDSTVSPPRSALRGRLFEPERHWHPSARHALYLRLERARGRHAALDSRSGRASMR